MRAGGYLNLLGVIGATMGRKLLVALQLEVSHHFIERRASRRSSRLEPPATFRTTKTPKALLLNPYQLPAHGGQILQAADLEVCRASYRHSPLHALTDVPQARH
jgi:hypothetical protein